MSMSPSTRADELSTAIEKERSLFWKDRLRSIALRRRGSAVMPNAARTRRTDPVVPIDEQSCCTVTSAHCSSRGSTPSPPRAAGWKAQRSAGAARPTNYMGHTAAER